MKSALEQCRDALESALRDLLANDGTRRSIPAVNTAIGAAEQALHLEHMNSPCKCGAGTMSDCYTTTCDKVQARAAAGPALAAQGEPVAWTNPTRPGPYKNITFKKSVAEKLPHVYSQPLYAAPVAQGEPAAWGVYVGDELMKPFGNLEQATEWARMERLRGSDYTYHIRDLYAAPTAAQPLTVEQINALWDDHTAPAFGRIGISPIVFARAIERAHGIAPKEPA